MTLLNVMWCIILFLWNVCTAAHRCCLQSMYYQFFQILVFFKHEKNMLVGFGVYMLCIRLTDIFSSEAAKCGLFYLSNEKHHIILVLLCFSLKIQKQQQKTFKNVLSFIKRCVTEYSPFKTCPQQQFGLCLFAFFFLHCSHFNSN